MKKRRSTAILVAAAMLFLMSVPLISGCKKSQELTESNYYTVSEWLSKVEDSFNMNYYTTEEPLIQSVMRDNPAFDIIQTAAEWELISAEDNLDFNDNITKELCADTLVSAMNFTDPASVDIADADKINASYLENVKIAVNEGVFALDNGSFDPTKAITKAEADAAMLIARNKWVYSSYGGVSYDRSVVKEGVVNLGGVRSENCAVTAADYSVQYTGSLQFFDADGNYTDNTRKTITFNKSNMPDISVGSLLTLPRDDVVPMEYAVRVTGITENPDGTVTVETENASVEDVYETLDMQYSGDVDFSDAVVFGPDGTRVTPDASSENMGMFLNGALETVSAAGNAGGRGAVMPTANKGGDFTIKLNDAVTLKIKIDGQKLTVCLDIKVKDPESGVEAKVSISKTQKYSLENKIDWGFAKLSIKSMKLALTTKDTSEYSISVGKTYNVDFAKQKITDANKDGSKDILDKYSEMKFLKLAYQELSGNYLTTTKLGSLIKDKTNVKLADFVLFNTPVHFVLRADLTLEAQYTHKSQTTIVAGVEYAKKHLRIINDYIKEKEEESISGKIELTFRAALELTALGVNIADLGVEAGGGFKCSSKLYRINPTTGETLEECAFPFSVSVNGLLPSSQGTFSYQANANIEMEDLCSCTEAKIYPILKAYGLSKGSIAGKFLGGIEAEIFGEDNAKILAHYENDNGFVDECTRGMADSYNVKEGKDLTANYDNLLLSVGETNKSLKLLTLPKGILLYDVKITSDNPEILKATNLMQASREKPKIKFTVRVGQKVSTSLYYRESAPEDKDQIALEGLADGTANVVIQCATQTLTIPVKVGNGGIENESEATFVVRNTSINLRGGESDTIVIDAAPPGYDLSQVTFTSADPNIAAVDKNGKVTAMKNVTGSVIIFISTNDGAYNAACLVNVLPQNTGSA